MTNTCRNWLAGQLIVAITSGAHVATAEERSESAVGQRVRSSDPVIASLIATGVARSPRFRRIIEAIDATNGLVYVEPGKCRNRVRACVEGMSTTRTHRIVLVRIRPDAPEWEIVATIAHELQHALEILSDPAVTTSRAMYLFYLRQGPNRFSGGFETDAAIDAGEAVLKELKRSPIER